MTHRHLGPLEAPALDRADARQGDVPAAAAAAAPVHAAAGSKLAARQAREAAALRANLRKRKNQARARDNPGQE
ncbi:MAG: hypothetical protein WDN25_09670 [Acetobacteraceae bacterium]